MSFYDASSQPEPPRQPSLLSLHARDVERGLDDVLAQIDDLADAGERRRRAEGVDDGLRALLESITGDERASFELRSIGRRVEQGQLTWEKVWARPYDEPGGPELVYQAMHAQGAVLREDLLRDLDADD